MDDWGTQIRLARVRAGLTQSQLADLSGITQATISRVESGDRWPQKQTVDRLLAVLAEAQPVGAMSVPGADPRHPATAHGELTELVVSELIGREPEPVDWVVSDLVARGAVTMLAGRYGQGKSAIAQALGVAMAEGRKHLAEWDVPPGKALIVDAENGAELIHSRLLGMGLTNDGAHNMRVVTARMFDIERDRDRLEQVIEVDVPDLLVLDTWGSLWRGAETSVEQVQSCLNGLREVAKTFSLGVLLLHHTTKTGETFRGSTAIGATIEGVFLLDRDVTDDSIRTVRCEKLRIGVEPPTRSFVMGYPITGLPD